MSGIEQTFDKVYVVSLSTLSILFDTINTKYAFTMNRPFIAQISKVLYLLLINTYLSFPNAVTFLSVRTSIPTIIMWSMLFPLSLYPNYEDPSGGFVFVLKIRQKIRSKPACQSLSHGNKSNPRIPIPTC